MTESQRTISTGTGCTIGGIEVSELTARWPTPFYVFDFDGIRDRVRAIKWALQGVHADILYAIKAYANVSLLRMLRTEQVGVDCCSPGDLAFAAAAVDDWPVVSYTGHAMTDAEIRTVASAPALFVADSWSQLRRYAGVSRAAPIGLRVNPALEHGFHPHVRAAGPAAKFGFRPDDIPDAVDYAKAAGLLVTTLHVHLGSDLLDPGPHLRALQVLIDLANAHPGIEVVDVGGGWGVPFTAAESAYHFTSFTVPARGLLAGTGLRLRIEPGTFLVRDNGYLVTTVVERRDDRDTVALGVDTSTNHLAGTLLFGTQHPHRATALGSEPAAVVGNLLLGGDVLLKEADFGAVPVGTTIVFGHAGAYSGVRASTFNERPRPAEIAVEAGTARLIRTAESVDDLLRDQIF